MRWQDRFFRRKRAERRLQAELAFHLDQKTAELIAAGLEPDEARRRARIDFGSLDRCQEACRESGRAAWFESWLQDLRYGLRQMQKAPGFTVVAVLTLALGIGANTAIFSLLDTVLWHALPYKHANRLVRIYPTEAKTGYGMVACSYPDFQDWRRQSHSFSGLAAYEGDDFNLAGQQPAERIAGLRITAGLLPLLGIHVLLGRNFKSGDGRQVALLSYQLWRNLYAANRQALGRSLILDGKPYTIVGVLPPHFYFPPSRWGHAPRVFLPIIPNTNRNGYYLRAIGRLAPRVTIRQAEAELQTIAIRLRRTYPHDENGGARLLPLPQAATGAATGPAWILFGAVFFVLLIACANLANLLLARGTARERELAIRGVLGAPRRRLARQLLTESLWLALGGGLLGIALAYAMLPLLARMAPLHTAFSTRVHDFGVHLNLAALAFAAGLSAAAMLIFGLVPAWTAAHPAKQLKPGLRTANFRSLLNVLELALALVLLSGAGLMLRSLMVLNSVKLGFRSDHLLTMRIHLTGKAYASPRAKSEFFVNALRRLRNLPGVRNATVINDVPLSRDWVSNGFAILGVHPRFGVAVYNTIGRGFFHTLGIPLLRGRIFNREHHAAPRECVINRSMARKYWPHANPLGETLEVVHLEQSMTAQGTQVFSKRLRFEIVGEVGDIRNLGLDVPPGPELYLPYWQYVMPAMGIVLRTHAAPMTLARSVRAALGQLAPEIPVTKFHSMDALIAQENAARKFILELLGAFALLAILLAAIGIYGTMTFSLNRRSHEFGIRMALGAQPGDIAGMAMRQGLKLTVLGLVLGLAGSIVLARVFSHFLFNEFFRLYGIGPYDPATFASVVIVLAGIALLASWLPARRVAKRDPLAVLRYE